MPPPIIALDRLTQRFEDRTVVEALTLSIAGAKSSAFSATTARARPRR